MSFYFEGSLGKLVRPHADVTQICAIFSLSTQRYCTNRFGPVLFAQLCITGETYFCIFSKCFILAYLFIRLFIFILFSFLANSVF